MIDEKARVTVYRKVGVTKKVCDLGHPHEVVNYVTKFITPTGETYSDNDGYTVTTMRILVDHQGRVYKEHRTFDMGQQFFTRAEDKTFWEPEYRIPKNSRSFPSE